MVEARCTRGCEGVCSVEIVGYLVSIKGDFVYEWMNELLYVYHTVYPLFFSPLLFLIPLSYLHRLLLHPQSPISHHPLPHHSNLTSTFLAGTNGLGTVS